MGQNIYTWTVTLTGNVIVEAGASGAGGGFFLRGGGAGAYARTAAMSVTSGSFYSVKTGIGGTPFNNGDDSTFTANFGVFVNARFGTAPGPGGDAALCTGDVTFSGGNGNATGGGDCGGGGSADDSGAGNNASGATGGAALPRSGKGGDGSNSTPAQSGSTPGAGGGSSVSSTNGSGADGYVIIWEDLGVWPPCGQTPIATFGSPPASFWAACATARVYSYIIA
jgi:hypothetical protein